MGFWKVYAFDLGVFPTPSNISSAFSIFFFKFSLYPYVKVTIFSLSHWSIPNFFFRQISTSNTLFVLQMLIFGTLFFSSFYPLRMLTSSVIIFSYLGCRHSDFHFFLPNIDIPCSWQFLWLLSHRNSKRVLHPTSSPHPTPMRRNARIFHPSTITSAGRARMRRRHYQTSTNHNGEDNFHFFQTLTSKCYTFS